MESVATAPRGRPREFCVDEALSQALRVFWTKGYEAASLTDLTEAMGITRPSLYAAFGNKEELFCKALDLYERDKLAYMNEALKAPTARGVAEHLLRGSLAMHCNTSEPKGCLGVISQVTCGAEAASIKAEVSKRAEAASVALLARLHRAKAEGDIPAHLDPEALKNYLFALLQGLAVQAGAGASPEHLTRLVDTTLEIWPTP